MKRILIINLVIVFVLSIAISANAQHLTGPLAIVDIRDFQEFIFGRGGSEGHSGAYFQLTLGVSGWDAIKVMEARARHVASGFEVTLREDTSCLKNYPPEWNIDASFFVMLRAEDWWMTGEWEFVLSYVDADGNKTEKATVVVPRFNFPPTPTGIQIAVVPPNPPGQPTEQKYLVWNRIGDPGTTWMGKRVEYRVRHFSRSVPCVDEDIVIRFDTSNYQLWSGNRIAFPLPTKWKPGDRIRIENRVYDDNPEVGYVYRFDRGAKDFILP